MRNCLGKALAIIGVPARGRRTVQSRSANGGWRNSSFQGYADHMASAGFADGLEQALAAAARSRTALMCAELLWWRCHRRLISDLLVHRGHQVLHIQTERAPDPHRLNPMAQRAGEGLIYPPFAARLALRATQPSSWPRAQKWLTELRAGAMIRGIYWGVAP